MKLNKSPMLCVLMFALWASTNELAADATVTFTDESDNEDTFQIQRNLNGGPFTTISTSPISPGVKLTVSVLDTTLVQSTTTDNKYCYRVFARNTAGDSPFASTATPGTTDCKVIPRLITIPVGGSGLLVK